LINYLALSTKRWVAFFILATFSTFSVAENAQLPKKIPKWRQVQNQAAMNSSKVCATPIISKKIVPNVKQTSFYTISLAADKSNADQTKQFLDIGSDAKTVFLNNEQDLSKPARQWLVTNLAANLYQIASCYQETPMCFNMQLGDDYELHQKNGTEVFVAPCDPIGIENQRWSMMQQRTGEVILGNNGLGQLSCMVETPDKKSVKLEVCDGKHQLWQFDKVKQDKLKQDASKLKKSTKSVVMVEYLCDSGEFVQTSYDEKQDQMHVLYKSKKLVLNPAVSGSGAKFGDANESWGWWTKGKQGHIYDTSTENTFIDNCTEVFVSK
jgi:membrane-bound inhibitor of C-type lysozyme